MDYREHHHLKVTSLGRAVLSGGQQVRLVSPETIKERQDRSKQRRAPAAATPDPQSADLLAALKVLRRTIAKQIAKPAYVVFSDAPLADMAERRPTTLHQFRLVNGVGDHKARLYAEQFIKAIAEH